MKSVTSQQMKALDEKAIHEYGIPSLLLMENAGRGIAELIFNAFRGRRVIVFCGKGNNGGDGLVAARHLSNRGFDVSVLLFTDPSALKNDPAVNEQIIRKMNIPCSIVAGGHEPVDYRSRLDRVDIVVDALFGVGLDKPLTGVYRDAVEAINQSGRNVVAVDVPSGLDSDTGAVLGVAVKASITATLACPKSGLFQGEGPQHAGKICVIDIGLPKILLK